MNSLWVFGYGSLLWEPGFAYQERVKARLWGWHRSFCMRSIHHRGTVDHPGLVLALDKADESHCDGVAFSVAPADCEPTLAYLRERELISSAYLEMTLPVALADGRTVDAVSYVIDPDHVHTPGIFVHRLVRIPPAPVGIWQPPPREVQR